MVGVDLGEDLEENEVGFANGIAVAQAGHVDIFSSLHEAWEVGAEGDVGAY